MKNIFCAIKNITSSSLASLLLSYLNIFNKTRKISIPANDIPEITTFLTFNMCGYKNIIVLTASSAQWIKRNIIFHRPHQKGCNNFRKALYQAMQNIINIKILMYRLLYLTNGHTRWV